MDDKLQTVPSAALSTAQQGEYCQDGNDNVIIPNYGTVNITVQQMPVMPRQSTQAPYTMQMPSMMPGGSYVPVSIDREYYIYSFWALRNLTSSTSRSKETEH